jgi:uncharacterized protein (DUF934 family)
MALLLKDGQIVKDNWHMVGADEEHLPSGNIILSLEQWQQQPSSSHRHKGALGVWIEGSTDIEPIAQSLIALPLVAIHFPIFTDGRGFSTARLLRERFNYQGELRAIGHFIRDQLSLLKNCGFSAFQFATHGDLTDAANSLNDFSVTYQANTEQPIPLYRRR